MVQEDRRVRRSRRLLGDALLRLLETHDLSTIKVRQVTDAADVGYMTFYRHYNNLDELLVDRASTLIEEEITQVALDCYLQAPMIFKHISEHLTLYQTILFSPSAARARQMMETMLMTSYLPTVIDDSTIPAILRSRTMAATAITLIQWWFEAKRTKPIAEMIKIYHRLVLDGNLDFAKMQALSLTNQAE